MEAKGKLIAKLDAPADGRFVAPHVFRVTGIEEMEREIFGPVLHVATFEADELDGVIAAINRKGYGLTFGLHTRIEARVQHIVDRIHAGNIYVNRNQIGAVVGSQPFGGEGLSGTGPKAGGPHYLRRFRKAPESGQALADGAQGDGDRTGRQSGRSPATGRRATIASPSCASICAARALRRSRPRRASISARSTCPGRRARRTRCRSTRAAACFASAPMPRRCWRRRSRRSPPAMRCWRSRPARRRRCKPCSARVCRSRRSTGGCDPIEAALAGGRCGGLFGHGRGHARSSARRCPKRKGPIVPLVSEVIYPAAYAHERAVCVDTTAAGGNASLLASA